MVDHKKQYTISFRLWEIDEQYKNATNLKKYIDEAQRFYNGDQYPNPNADNRLRVTMNICSFSTQLKAAKVVGTPTYIQFVSDNENVDCTALQRFDEYNLSKLNEKTENYQSALNGFNDGTAIVYYCWNDDDSSYKGIYKGGLCLEHIDPRNFAVANPYVRDIQNQKWVMFWKDEEVAAVREMCENEDLVELILPEDYESKRDFYSKNPNYVNHALVRVYTRFFRIDGEVYFTCETKDVSLFKYPHAINPRVNKAVIEKIVKDYEKKIETDTEGQPLEQVPDFDIDFEKIVTQITKVDELTDDEYKEIKEKFSIYPFATYVPFVMNGSFYGRSDIKSLIPTQKTINHGLSMLSTVMQNLAYTKIIVKEDALQGQEITNEPGQILTDYSRFTNGFGIKFAETQPMPNGILDFLQQFIQLTRVFNGFNDVMDGSVSNQDISGYAIQQMIKQSNSTIEQQQQLFWAFLKEKAQIRLMFYKFFVDKAKYTYEIEDYEVEAQEQARKTLLARNQALQAKGEGLEIGEDILPELEKPTKKVKVMDFRGEEIYGSNFDITIDVMQGLVNSELAESQMWDTLILNGGIQNLSPDMLEAYIHANPTVSQHTKNALKSIIEKQKKSENYQLKQQLQEAIKHIEKLLQYSQELESQNGYFKTYVANLQKEFGSKIGMANKIIKEQDKRLSSTQTTVSEGEAKSNNAKGISGSDIQ